MNPDIERVAEAIAATQRARSWLLIGSVERDNYRIMARAAVEALGLTEEIKYGPT